MEPREKPRPPRAPEPESRDDVVVARNRCPFCHEDVPQGATGWVACAACLARHHEACWGEAGRCGTCRHAERLRPDARGGAPASPHRVALVAAVIAVLLLVGGGVAWRIVTVAARERAVVEALEAERRVAEEAARAAAERAEREADPRFSLARRVDELRALKRSGSRADARTERRRAARKQAKIEVALVRRSDELERARLDAALRELERLDPPPRFGGDGPVESILEEQDEYLMPPRPDHPDHASMVERMRGTPNPAYQGHLRLLEGTREGAQAALEGANRELDQHPTSWLGWCVRGEALTALGDHAGAAMALHLAEGFSSFDPTWTLLARVDLAHARGDRQAELRAAFDALEVGAVPEWGGHLDALFTRIARLEQELGAR